MDEYLRPDRPPTNPPRSSRNRGGRTQARPHRQTPITHSPEHVLNHCPLMAPFRHIIADPHTGHIDYHNLFHTIKGAYALANFLLRSNSLLRPLPPRPDPP